MGEEEEELIDLGGDGAVGDGEISEETGGGGEEFLIGVEGVGDESGFIDEPGDIAWVEGHGDEGGECEEKGEKKAEGKGEGVWGGDGGGGCEQSGGGLLAVEMAEGFVDCGDEEWEALADGAGISGEIDEESGASGACGGAGEDGGGDSGERLGADDFAEAWEFAIENRPRGFWGDIAWAGAGAAGGEDELAIEEIAEIAESLFDLGLFVGEDYGDPFGVTAIEFGPDAFDFRATEVFVDACLGTIAEGDAGNFHCLIFSVTRMLVMLIWESTALHIS